MKFLLPLFLFVSLSVQAGISIISDLDDTIKITEASGRIGDLIGDKFYTGMDVFYKGAREYPSDLYVLSASPEFMRLRVKSILKKKGIAFEKLELRANIFEKKFNFKTRQIAKILQNSDNDFILIGDDVGKDPEIYAHIQEVFPNRILRSYIHVVTGRELPENVVPYWTSFDLALRELLANRMRQETVAESLKLLLEEDEIKFIFPKKANCPSEATLWDWQLSSVFAQDAQLLVAKLVSYCKVRQSVIILQ